MDFWTINSMNLVDFSSVVLLCESQRPKPSKTSQIQFLSVQKIQLKALCCCVPKSQSISMFCSPSQNSLFPVVFDWEGSLIGQRGKSCSIREHHTWTPAKWTNVLYKKGPFQKESSSSQPLILSRFVSFEGSDRGLTSIYSHMYYTVGGSEIWWSPPGTVLKPCI